MKRIYLYGIYGSGKSVFSHMLQPEAVVVFQAWGVVFQLGVPAPAPVDYPWLTYRTCSGDPVWPPVVGEDGAAFTCDPAQAASYRALLGISPTARLCRIWGEGLMLATPDMSSVERLTYIRTVQERLEADFDAVVCDFSPFDAHALPDEDDHVVSLLTPYETLLQRSATPAGLGRPPVPQDTYRQHLAYVISHRGMYWRQVTHQASTLWWTGENWIPVEGMIRQRLQELGYWYQYHEVGGVPTGPVHGLNGSARWECIKALLPQARGRFLDIGANSGFNSIQAAKLGWEVVAVEPDPRYAAQFQLVLDWGWPRSSIHDRVRIVEAPAQTLRLCEQRFDFALLSCVHYHINRSDETPYRAPQEHGIPHLRPPLAVVLEDLFASTNTIIIITNEAHLAREVNPYPEAHRDWVADTLRAFGAARVDLHPGDAPDRPILVAQVKT